MRDLRRLCAQKERKKKEQADNFVQNMHTSKCLQSGGIEQIHEEQIKKQRIQDEAKQKKINQINHSSDHSKAFANQRRQENWSEKQREREREGGREIT